ncbi:MAG: CHAT domain-containing protein [Xanthobacteraceae bacterium]
MSSIFWVQVREGREGFTVSARIDGRSAEANLGVLSDQIAARLEPLQREIILTSRAVTDPVSPADPANDSGASDDNAPVAEPDRSRADVRIIREIGRLLFDALFQQNVFALYDETYKAALNDRKELIVRLHVDSSILAKKNLPWETLFTGDLHLCCSKNTPFSRTIALQEDSRTIATQAPLRILVVVASPKGTRLAPLDAVREQNALRGCLEKLERENKLKLGLTTAGTLTEIRQKIEDGDAGAPWDVLHFIGHGMAGKVALEAESGRGAEWIDAEQLRGELDAPLGPQLVIMNSCQGATSGPEDRFSSTADMLVRGGRILAAIAMQFVVSDKLSIHFSPIFYDELLVKKRSLQGAMTRTRLELRRRGFAEWITPVLYMRSRDVSILRPDAPAAAASG